MATVVQKPEAQFGWKHVFAGELFAQAPVSQYPGSVVEAVTDSSRYFVIRIEDGNGKAHLANICLFKCICTLDIYFRIYYTNRASVQHVTARSICIIYPACV